MRPTVAEHVERAGEPDCPPGAAPAAPAGPPRQGHPGGQGAAGPAAATAHMLSFDVEEYFHVEAAADTVRPEDWAEIPRRLARPVDRILALLAEHRAAATFFVLGWVARDDPDLVRRIAESGCEIASHGVTHAMIGRLSPRAFRRELADGRKLLEDISGRAVLGYRAPTFSVTHETAWALDVLAEAGFSYDSSVYPVHHDRYGVADAPIVPHVAAGPGGGRILEIPPLTLRVLGANLPVGGGGYLRLLPVRVVGAALRKACRRGGRGMIYLHPWELDPDQPVLPMGRLSRWRHRVNLTRTEAKLRWLLERFRFTDVRGCLGELTASALQTFSYGRP